MINNKITVGVLIGNICASHSDDLLNGIVHCAAEMADDVQTLFFMGAHANCFDELYYYEGGNKEQKYLFQFNTIFDYAKLGKLDVLIILYSTFYLYMWEEKEEFFAKFEDLTIPVIIVGDEYRDYPNVMSDNMDGIQKCMEHLIENHGCRKIAYLSGPKENNRDAAARLEAYLMTMEKYGLEILDGMIEYGDYSANSASLFGKILDAHPDVDAVVCANDTMALAGYDECRSRGLIPGKDVAITGFDDIPEAKSAFPALTTVEQNSYDLGYVAMKQAIAICQGQNPASVRVPVYFKHRESCGSDQNLEENIYDITSDDSLDRIAKLYSEEIIQKVFLYKLSIVEDTVICDLLYHVLYHILTVYLGEKELDYDLEFIDVSINTLVNSDKLNRAEFITELCRQITNISFWNNDGAGRKKLLGLMMHILSYTQTVVVIDTNNRIDNLQRNIWTTPFITRDMIANIDDNDQLYESLMERLRFMKINNAYLFLLDEPKINQSMQDWSCPEELKLVVKIEDGEIRQDCGGVKLDREHGLADILAWENSQNMAAYSLFAGARMYGILVCEMTTDNITSMYSVSLHIGSAFQFLNQTRTQRTVQAELEQALAELKNKNSILNMISEKDVLTGLYNRRGFLEHAMTLISHAKKNYILCIYADLDHLKQINDEYGHNEGDFAIKKVGEYLQECLSSDAVIGRIGGDEFAAVAMIQNQNMAKELREKIILKSKLFNQSSDKDYYVETSVGCAVYKWSKGLELNHMLSTADLKLYESKTKRRKDIRKNPDNSI
jgi:diguanylate cyclase (GGDEF)-like protein